MIDPELIGAVIAGSVIAVQQIRGNRTSKLILERVEAAGEANAKAINEILARMAEMDRKILGLRQELTGLPCAYHAEGRQ